MEGWHPAEKKKALVYRIVREFRFVSVRCSREYDDEPAPGIFEFDSKLAIVLEA